jgi:hypothetical protein
MAFSGEYMVPIQDAQKLERELAESKKNGCDTCDAFTLANRQLREDVVNLAKQIDPYEREAAKAAINALKRELAEVTKQRDHYKKACDQYSEDEMLCKLQETTKQRDALAEALGPFVTLNPLSKRVQERWHGYVLNAKQALAATKGELHE